MRERDGNLVCHADGAPYVSIGYTERLAEVGIEPSVGSRGDSCFNALAETIHGPYKAELIHRRSPWKTRETVKLSTLQRVAWFNHPRLLEVIGDLTLAAAEANHWRRLASQDSMAKAWLTSAGFHESRGGSASSPASIRRARATAC